MGAIVAYILGAETSLMPFRSFTRKTMASMPHAVTQNHKKIVRKSR
jgi:hypothetical protein